MTCLHEIGHRKEALFEKLFSEHPSEPRVSQHACILVERSIFHALSSGSNLGVNAVSKHFQKPWGPLRQTEKVRIKRVIKYLL